MSAFQIDQAIDLHEERTLKTAAILFIDVVMQRHDISLLIIKRYLNITKAYSNLFVRLECVF